jgi:hypothetical protein
MSLLARCADCAKTYRVPHDRKEWHCKQCQAVLEIESAAGEPSFGEPEFEGRACPDCGALAFGDEAFCVECGADLHATAEESARATKKDRRQAAGEMRRVFQRLERLKTFLAINYWLSWLGALLLPLVFLSDDFTTNLKVLTVAIVAITIGLAWAGLKYVDIHPFPVVMTLAGFETLEAIWNFSNSEGWLFSAIWAAVLWILAVDAAQITRLSKQYPDLYHSRRLRGEHLKASRVDNPSTAVRERALVRERERKTRRRRAIGIGVVLALLLAAAPIIQVMDRGNRARRSDTFANRPDLPAPDEVIERFRVSWNAGDVAGMVAITKSSSMREMEHKLQSLGELYDWGTHFPPLERAYWDAPRSSMLNVDYVTPVSDLPVRFVVEDGAWVLYAVGTRAIKDWRPE